MRFKNYILLLLFIFLIQECAFASKNSVLEKKEENKKYLYVPSSLVGLAEHRFMEDLNSGKYELWHTITMGCGWTNSSWGRWKYGNALDYTRQLQGDPYVGALAVGWCKIDGEWYYFDPNNENIMATNCIIDGFQIGADGKMINVGIEPNGMNYDTVYSYLKVKKDDAQKVSKTEQETSSASKTQIYIANNLRVVKNETVIIHKPIFDGDDKEEVESINSQFEEMFDEIIENYIDNEEGSKNIDISAKISSISKTKVAIEIIKKDNNDTKILETLCFDREEQNLTTYAEYLASE